MWDTSHRGNGRVKTGGGAPCGKIAKALVYHLLNILWPGSQSLYRHLKILLYVRNNSLQQQMTVKVTSTPYDRGKNKGEKLDTSYVV